MQDTCIVSEIQRGIGQILTYPLHFALLLRVTHSDFPKVCDIKHGHSIYCTSTALRGKNLKTVECLF